MKLIDKIEIRHFRSIYDQEVKGLTHLNIFGGQNDSGKSNLLKALNLFFNGQTSFLKEFDFFDDFSMSSKAKARESKKGRQFISIRIYFNINEIKGKTELRQVAKTNGGLWVERKWWAYHEAGTYEQNEPDYIKNASQGIKRSFSVLLGSIKFVYIPAFKSEEVFSYILRLSARNNGLFLSKSAKEDLDKNIEKITTDFSTDFKDITGIQTSITLPISLESFWSSLEVNSQFEGTPEKFTRGSEDDYKIKFNSRGEGIKSLFIPVVLGWLAKKSSLDHWIWGIDEPENALEALRADNLFLKFIEYSNAAQIFVSTHSPSFIFPQEESEKCSVFIADKNELFDTRFSRINDQPEELQKLFGASYGAYMQLQNQYAKDIKKTKLYKEKIANLESELGSLKKPVIFVEGELDVKYWQKTIEIFKKREYFADVRWIGSKDMNGNCIFTGSTALNQARQMICANPEALPMVAVLLYDIDTNKESEEIISNRLFTYCPKKFESATYQSGVEHLLNLPVTFKKSKYESKQTKTSGDKVTTISEPDKVKLCEDILSEDKKNLKEILKNFNMILEEIEKKCTQ